MNPFELHLNDSQLHLRLTSDATIEHTRPLFTAVLEQLPLVRSVEVDAADLTSVHPAILQVLLAAAVKVPLRVSAGSDSWNRALQRLGLEDTILAPLAPTASNVN